jgi:hypothetical protein
MIDNLDAIPLCVRPLPRPLPKKGGERANMLMSKFLGVCRVNASSLFPLWGRGRGEGVKKQEKSYIVETKSTQDHLVN